MKILSTSVASNLAVCLIKWMEGKMRKKFRKLTVNMRVWARETEGWNYENTEPKADNRNGERNKTDRAE
jgi:hypothetical protein